MLFGHCCFPWKGRHKHRACTLHIHKLMQLPHWSYKANYWNHQLYIISLLSSSFPDPFHLPPSLLKAEQSPFLPFNSFHSPNPSPHDAYIFNHLSAFLSGLFHPYLCCSVSYLPEVGTADRTAFHVLVKGHHCLHSITENSKWFLKDFPPVRKISEGPAYSTTSTSRASQSHESGHEDIILLHFPTICPKGTNSMPSNA